MRDKIFKVILICNLHINLKKKRKEKYEEALLLIDKKEKK